jgi:hypothetical protein
VHIFFLVQHLKAPRYPDSFYSPQVVISQAKASLKFRAASLKKGLMFFKKGKAFFIRQATPTKQLTSGANAALSAREGLAPSERQQKSPYPIARI